MAFALLAITTWGCSSGTGGNGDTVTPSVPDFAEATQEILPVMRSADTNEAVPLTSFFTKAVDYAPVEWWSDEIVFKWMTDRALSTNPEDGTESVFNLVAQVQVWIDQLASANAFVITDGECQLPEIEGVEGEVTRLTAADNITLPYLHPRDGSDYDCLVVLSTPPFEGATAYSYAFSNYLDAYGDPFLSRIAFAVTTDWGEEIAYNVFVATYNQFHSEFDVDFVSFVDKEDDFSMRALYSGATDARSFTFKSTLRGPLDQCDPVATNIESEAKKLGAIGVSDGEGAGFIMKLQRVCDQKAPVTSTEPQYFCMDAVSKSPADDDSICESYEDEMEDTILVRAESVPFSPDDFANDNVITYTTRTWADVGGGYLSTEGANVAAMAFDTTNDIVYVAYVAGNSKVHVVKSSSGEAWESIGSFSEGVDSTVGIAVADGVPYVAYYVASPPPTGIIMKRYIDGEWETVTRGITGQKNTQLLYEAPYIYLGRTKASADGKIYISKFDTTSDTWTTLGDGGNDYMGNSIHYIYSMAVYDGTVYVAQSSDGVQVKQCEANCTSWTELGSNTDLTTTEPESVSITATGDGPRVAYALVASPWLEVKIYWDEMWRRYAGYPETVFTNLNGIHLASEISEVYIAYEDAENDGHLTVQRFRASGWETMGDSVIDISSTVVADFNVVSGTPYLMYKDPTANRLILKKFE